MIQYFNFIQLSTLNINSLFDFISAIRRRSHRLRRPGQRGGVMLTMLEVHPSLSSGQAEPSGRRTSVRPDQVGQATPFPPEEGRARLPRRGGRGRASGPPAQPRRRAASPPRCRTCRMAAISSVEGGRRCPPRVVPAAPRSSPAARRAMRRSSKLISAGRRLRPRQVKESRLHSLVPAPPLQRVGAR